MKKISSKHSHRFYDWFTIWHLSLTLDFHCFKITKIKMSHVSQIQIVANYFKLHESFNFQRHFWILSKLLICFVLTQYLLSPSATETESWASLSKTEQSNQLKFVLISRIRAISLCFDSFDFKIFCVSFGSFGSSVFANLVSKENPSKLKLTVLCIEDQAMKCSTNHQTLDYKKCQTDSAQYVNSKYVHMKYLNFCLMSFQSRFQLQ